MRSKLWPMVDGVVLFCAIMCEVPVTTTCFCAVIYGYLLFCANTSRLLWLQEVAGANPAAPTT